MKLYSKKIFISILFLKLSIISVSASSILIDAPDNAPSTRQPIVVRLLLDAKGDTISGMSGNFSFPTDLFDVESISNENSIVSLWVKQPSVSSEKYLDGRTHIVFEGIFPGGYSGISSPYYAGLMPGTIATITLTPKAKGTALLLVDDIILNEYSSEAKPLKTESALKIVAVPDLVGNPKIISQSLKYVENKSLSMLVTRDSLVNNNAWYLLIESDSVKSSLSKVYVAETDDVSALTVRDSDWRDAALPYVLLFQDRSKYIHVKILYANNSYSLKTIEPVENPKSISSTSRILVYVIIVFLLLYLYGKNLLLLYRKKE